MHFRKFYVQLMGILVCFLNMQTTSAKEHTWNYMKVDNVEVIANIPEKELIKLHDEIFYFNRTIETLLPSTKKQVKDTIKVLIVPSSRALMEVIGKEDLRVAGSYGGLPSIKIITLRSSNRDREPQRTLFWGLTNHKLKPLNRKRWFTEALASLLRSTEVERNKIEFGFIREGLNSYMRFGTNASDANLHNMFVNDMVWNMALGDSDEMLYYKAHSYYFAHYCLLGNKTLLKPFLDFSKESLPSEEQFTEHFGFDFKELKDRLWGYATKGRHRFFSIDKSTLPKPPTPIVRLANESEWQNALIRAKFNKEDKTEARALLYQMPENDPIAVETRGILAFVDKNKVEVLEQARKAQELGVVNPILQVTLVNDDLSMLLRERRKVDGPKLSKAEAEVLINKIKPSLKYYRKYIASVRTLIRILNASEAKVHPGIDPLFKAWEDKEVRRYPKLKSALDEIRKRSGIPISTAN